MITFLLYYLYLNKSWNEMNETKRFLLFITTISIFMLIPYFVSIPIYTTIWLFAFLFVFRFPYIMYFHGERKNKNPENNDK